MMIITDCDRCNRDFMYDPNTDTHLNRVSENNVVKHDGMSYDPTRVNMPLNTGALGLSEEDLKDHDTETIICQRCDSDEYLANILESFITLAEVEHPEFQEEHTTGWDLMENAKEQLIRLKEYKQ